MVFPSMNCLARRMAVVLAILSGFAAPSWAGFTIQDLGVITPSGTSGGLAINAVGRIAGSATSSLGNTVAVTTSGAGRFQQVSSNALGSSSVANAININGDVGGTYIDGSGNRRGFYTANGNVTSISPLAGGTYTQINGLNKYSEMVGTGDTANGTTRAFTLSPGGSPTAINPLGTGTFSQGGGVNDNGTVVGSSEISAGGPVHAFIESMGNPAVDLLTRNPGSNNFSYNTYGVAIANNGDVAGYGDVGRFEHAFYAPSNGGPLVDLGVLPGGSSSKAHGLNDQAQIVGEIDYGSVGPGQPGSQAFLWDATYGMYNLNQLIPSSDQANWTLTLATGINDSDQITGIGLLNGVAHGFLLTPIGGESIFDPAGVVVPEPPASLMVVSGLAMVAAWSKFRRGRIAGPAAA